MTRLVVSYVHDNRRAIGPIRHMRCDGRRLIAINDASSKIVAVNPTEVWPQEESEWRDLTAWCRWNSGYSDVGSGPHSTSKCLIRNDSFCRCQRPNDRPQYRRLLSATTIVLPRGVTSSGTEIVAGLVHRGEYRRHCDKKIVVVGWPAV